MTRVRIRNSESGPAGRRVWRSLWAAVIAPVLMLALLIPLVRRYRRRRGWKWVQAGGWAASLVLIAAGGTAGQLAGIALLLAATLLGPAPDPDGLRKLAEKLGARHVVNAGRFVAGSLPLEPATPLLIFVTAEEVLLSPAWTPDRVQARYRLDSLDAIWVEGESFRPRNYISFAKDPPQRDPAVDRNAACGLVLSFSTARLELQYRGAFARHLAEIAAHTLYQCREAGRWSPVDALRVITRQ